MNYSFKFKQESLDTFSLLVDGGSITRSRICYSKKQIMKKFRQKFKALRRKNTFVEDKPLLIFASIYLIDYAIKTCARFLNRTNQYLVTVVLVEYYDMHPKTRSVLGRELSLLTHLKRVTFESHDDDEMPLFQRLCRQSTLCQKKPILMFTYALDQVYSVSFVVLRRGIQNNFISLSEEQATTKIFRLLMKV